MKTYLIVLLLLFCSCYLHAQINPEGNHTKNKLTREIGLVVALGKGNMERKTPLDGEASYSGKKYFAVGITYVESLKTWLSIETDPAFAKYSIKRTNTGMGENTSSIFHVQLLTIPVQARVHFLRYFFVNAGAFLDLDLGIIEHGQSGIGVMAGIGIQYPIAHNTNLFINPYVQQHAVWSFKEEDNPLRLHNAGVRVGVTYRFLK